MSSELPSAAGGDRDGTTGGRRRSGGLGSSVIPRLVPLGEEAVDDARQLLLDEAKEVAHLLEPCSDFRWVVRDRVQPALGDAPDLGIDAAGVAQERLEGLRLRVEPLAAGARLGRSTDEAGAGEDPSRSADRPAARPKGLRQVRRGLLRRIADEEPAPHPTGHRRHAVRGEDLPHLLDELTLTGRHHRRPYSVLNIQSILNVQQECRSRSRQTPIGCQTVLSSRNAEIHSGRCAARSSVQSNLASVVPAGLRATRFTLSAAVVSTATRIASGTPQVSIASTSACAASTGTSSRRRPVSMLTTPPGTSDVARTSDSVTAGSGRDSDASTTAALPDTTTGASRLTRPSSELVSGATIPTTPVGSGIVKLKYGAATGFEAPSTCAILSAQPAYQTQRSTDRPTTSRATASLTPSASQTSATNWSRRPSISSATR